ncbi:DUF3868 domain-containing protein [Prevotella sp. 10(H)]|uniref:DUF3868 domain-containing protein n=1 Tax=Prevotella sp. 10(H) TaxID=1158294 RepID=UPI0004A7140D|nr:DUF3868 domain-containing protein [Prevotella sp. 10(H)]
MNKKIIFALTLAMLCCIQLSVLAQGSSGVKFKDVEFKHDNKDVNISMYLNLQDYYVEVGDSLTLTPIIRSTTNMLPLQNVVLIGQGKQGFYLSDMNYAEQSFRIPVASLNPQKNIFYQTSVPYESWMDNSMLDMRVELNQIGGFPLYNYSHLVENQIREEVKYEQVPASLPVEYAELKTSRPVISSEAEVREATLYDIQLPEKNPGSYRLADPNDIETIRHKVKQIIEDNTKSLMGIYITAFTSVDGIYIDNENMTMKQAFDFKDQIHRGIDCPESLFFIDWKGEDWSGLEDLIKQSDMDYKSEALTIINNTGIFAGRERKLMSLANGRPYRYMKENLFPQQWRIECKVVYKNR